MKRRCGGKDLCSRWGWEEDVPDFYARISTIFPNLDDYGVIKEGKKAVRRARLKKFEEMGVILGIFEGEGRISEEFREVCGWKNDRISSFNLLICREENCSFIRNS